MKEVRKEGELLEISHCLGKCLELGCVNFPAPQKSQGTHKKVRKRNEWPETEAGVGSEFQFGTMRSCGRAWSNVYKATG